MRLHVWSALFAAVLSMCMVGITSYAGNPRFSVVSAPPAQVFPGDNDGDGLPDDLDPDDDNDGIMDQNDPAEYDASLPGSNVPLTPDPDAHDQDSDGDGLADDLDPDDDNDGILDQSDPAPYDASLPGSNVPLTPDPNAHDQDSDGDEIANDIDPDDNNDGVLDVDTAPATTPPPTTITSTPHPADRPKSAPVVTALPSTGSGDEQPSLLLPLVLTTCLATLLASVGIFKAPSAK